MKPRLAEVATDHMTPERMLKLFAAATSASPKLKQCSIESLAASLLLASQLGLEPASPLGHLYLVPYGTKCTPIIGYKGMLELIRRTGEVSRINAQVFYRQELESGAVRISIEPPDVTHEFSGEAYGVDDVAGSYCIVEAKDGARYVEICTRPEIDARRDRSASGKDGPWETDFRAMARKCAIRKLFGGGTVPISAEKMASVSLAMEGDGDSGDKAPRMSRAQRNMSRFTIPATGEVVETEARNVSHYDHLMMMAKDAGASDAQLGTAMTALDPDWSPETMTADDVSVVMAALEAEMGA
jgi:recombination protein RecT